MRYPERDGILRVNRRQLVAGGTWDRRGGCFGSPLSLEPGEGGPGWAGHAASWRALVAAAAGDLQFDPYYRIVPAWWSFGTLYNALYGYSGRDPTQARTAARRVGRRDRHHAHGHAPAGREVPQRARGRCAGCADNIDRAKDESSGIPDCLLRADGRQHRGCRPVHGKITYIKPYALKREDLETLFLLPKEAMADIATNPVGTGPFKFVSFAQGDQLELTRWDDYFEDGLPHPRRPHDSHPA